MNQLNPIFQNVLSWLVTLLVPLILLMTAFRLLLTPVFVQVEYRTPNFPADSFGFTQDDRLRWAPIALAYLLNDADVSFLGDLTFDDGGQVYNERELSHMVDVKDLVVIGLKVWYALLALLLALGVWAWRAGWWRDFSLMLASGGKLTMFLLTAMIVFVFINFNQLFTSFHRIFFQGDTWLFLFSDTLIRLFPMRFWRDAFILAGSLTFLGGAALWYYFERRPLK